MSDTFDPTKALALCERRYRPVSWAEFCELQDQLRQACAEVERVTQERDKARADAESMRDHLVEVLEQNGETVTGLERELAFAQQATNHNSEVIDHWTQTAASWQEKFDAVCKDRNKLTAERDALWDALQKIATREKDNLNDETQHDQCIRIATEALQKIGSGELQSVDSACAIARDALERGGIDLKHPKGKPGEWLAALRKAGGE